MDVIATCALRQASPERHPDLRRVVEGGMLHALLRRFACIRIWFVIVHRSVWGVVDEAVPLRERCWYNGAAGTALSGAALETFSSNGRKQRGRTYMW